MVNSMHFKLIKVGNIRILYFYSISLHCKDKISILIKKDVIQIYLYICNLLTKIIL